MDITCLNEAHGNDWSLYNGDTVEIARQMPSGCVDLALFSPPFSSLYTYSDSERDMGNCADDREFFVHYRYLAEEITRLLRPGRLCLVHCKDLVDYNGRDGRAGLRDFPGELIRCHEEAGLKFHSRVTIWKDPVVEQQRTKAHGLLYCQLRKDSSFSRQGMAEYLLGFRKWADEDDTDVVPVEHTRESFTLPQWQQWASPVWMDIRQTNTLNVEQARDDRDEKHMCVARGSLVLTRDGQVPIEDVEEGAFVLTHKGRWRRVTAKARMGTKDVVCVRAPGLTLRVTPDHRLWTCGAGSARPEWVHAESTLGAYVNLRSDSRNEWAKVSAIEPAGEAEVWDLQVDEDESFTAEGCVVHNCPLQLDVIERGVKLWSNPGETVYSPFAGIASEGVGALKAGRKFFGIELKESYFRTGVANLRETEGAQQLGLFGRRAG